MVNLKIELEKHFNTNWISTPIQWEGIDIQAPSDGKWIGLKFNPIDRTQYAYDGSSGRTKDQAQLEVSCYATSTTKSLSLGDEVKAFIENWNYSGIDANVGLGVPDGNGVINLDNYIFESVLTFQIKSYN